MPEDFKTADDSWFSGEASIKLELFPLGHSETMWEEACIALIEAF